MSFPTDGTNGWEAFGTDVEAGAEQYALPVTERGFYYDPARLNGLGLSQTATVHTFNGATLVVRRRVSTIEAEFAIPYVWADALLDEVVVPEIGNPCALVLKVFADDRETVLWEVGTSPTHANPYLIEPENYAEQEVDVATGSASVGTVAVGIIDPATTTGDQDSGWVTARLAEQGIEAIRGRRCQLRRYISDEIGWVVIADGPAGTPRLDTSYAAYAFDIRDTRDTERKIRLFDAGGEQSILPEGTLEGYGYDPVTDTWLIDPTTPLEGTYTSSLGLVSLTGPGGATTAEMTYAAFVNTLNGLAADFSGPDTPETWVNRTPYWFRWRPIGSTGGWTEIRETLSAVVFNFDPIVPFSFDLGLKPEGSPVTVVGIFIGSYPDGAGLPADGQSIEFQLIGPRGVAPTSDIPFTVDGITTGEFIRNAYDGKYSARAQDGTVVPTGIRYDSAALDAMTDPVRLHLTSAIDDARDWLESHIYAPTGWAPALNDLGEISPVSQVAPTTTAGLLVLDDAITEPAPNWNAGERLINILRLTYQRDYRPTDPDEAETGDGLASRDINIEFRDDVSIDRNGEQALELTLDAFRAIGDADAEPVSGEVYDETGYLLAQLRQTHVQARYSFGAPVIAVAVMRSATPGLRAGSWVVVDLSWFPDLITNRRGLIAIGQVIALGDLDCKWRQVVLEVTVPLTGSS